MASQLASKRIDSLTGVRILAAGGVFLSHIPAPDFLPLPVRTFAGAGYNGVTLFFMLSGFVLAWSWADRIVPIRGATLWSFAVARFARIYPLYLFALLVVVAPRFAANGWDPVMALHATGLQTFSSHLERVFVYNSPGWSVGVEVFLYACFPVVVLALARLRSSNAKLLAACMLVILAMFALTWWFVATGRGDLAPVDPESAHRWLYRSPFTRLGDFTVGVILAYFVQNYRAPSWMAIAAQTTGGLAAILLMMTPALYWTAWSWDFAYLIPFALLIWGLAAGPHSLLSRTLSTKPMRAAGEASFAFYLLHWPLLAAFPVQADGFGEWIVSSAVLFSLTLLVAFGAHAVIEKPAQQWLRQTLDKQSRKPARSAAAPHQVPVGAGQPEQR